MTDKAIRRLPRWLPYVVATPFFLYIVISAFQLLPDWSARSGEENFAIAKHLVVLGGISAYLCINPRIGSWIAIAWGVFVPFERYQLLLSTLVRGSLTDSFAPLDVVRLVILLVATCSAVSLAIAIALSSRVTHASATNADA